MPKPDKLLAKSLEKLFASHPRKKLSPEFLHDLATLKDGNERIDRTKVIVRAIHQLDNHTPGHSREETLLALDLLQESLIEHTMALNPLLILGRLRRAIADLEKGIVDLILRPNRPANRVQDSRPLSHSKLVAAAACEALIQLKEGRQQSANRVADFLNKIGFPPTGRLASSGTVLYWRQVFNRKPHFKDYVRAMVNAGHKKRIFEYLESKVSRDLEDLEVKPPC
jgi:hypothetical protein